MPLYLHLYQTLNQHITLIIEQKPYQNTVRLQSVQKSEKASCLFFLKSEKAYCFFLKSEKASCLFFSNLKYSVYYSAGITEAEMPAQQNHKFLRHCPVQQ